MPKRIQMSRQHPWRAENPDAVIVARPSKWGNPFAISGAVTRGEAVAMFRSLVTEENNYWLAKAVALRKIGLHVGDFPRPYPIDEVPDLAGKDLACWCPLDEPCHADVLLELANGAEGTP